VTCAIVWPIRTRMEHQKPKKSAHLASSGKEAHSVFQIRGKMGMGRVSAPPKVSVQTDDSSAVCRMRGRYSRPWQAATGRARPQPSDLRAPTAGRPPILWWPGARSDQPATQTGTEKDKWPRTAGALFSPTSARIPPSLHPCRRFFPRIITRA
jgi:hypothetical protein